MRHFNPQPGWITGFAFLPMLTFDKLYWVWGEPIEFQLGYDAFYMPHIRARIPHPCYS